MTALIVAAVLATLAVVAVWLLPLVWPDRAYDAEMARRDAAAAELLNHEQDTP